MNTTKRLRTFGKMGIHMTMACIVVYLGYLIGLEIKPATGSHVVIDTFAGTLIIFAICMILALVYVAGKGWYRWASK